MVATKARKPEFNPQNPQKKPGEVAQSCDCGAGGGGRQVDSEGLLARSRPVRDLSQNIMWMVLRVGLVLLCIQMLNTGSPNPLPPIMSH